MKVRGTGDPETELSANVGASESAEVMAVPGAVFDVVCKRRLGESICAVNECGADLVDSLASVVDTVWAEESTVVGLSNDKSVC